MGKFAYIEQKMLTLMRGVIVLLALIFLIFALWWVVLTLPSAFSGWGSGSGADAKKVSAMSGFTPAQDAFSAAMLETEGMQGSTDVDTIKLQEAMKQPSNAEHYDNVIHNIRAFADRDKKQRAAIEAQAAESGDTLMAPVEFEAVDKYTTLCSSEEVDVAVAVAGNATVEEESTESLCGRTTVREIVADNVTYVLNEVTSDADKKALHAAYIAGLDQSIARFLENKSAARDNLKTMSTGRIARALVSAYDTQFREKLTKAAPDQSDQLLAFAKGITPLGLLSNPFFIGTILFLMLFVYLTMMLVWARLERNLRKGL